MMPMASKRSLWVMGRTMASMSSWICLSSPPMSLYSSVGFSSTSIAFTRESYSAGRVSSMRYESLLTPTRSPGLSAFASTSPITGRKIVCLVEVLRTTHFPLRCESRSTFAPSSAGSSSGFKSKISTTFPTRYGSCLLTLIFSLFSLIFSFMAFCSCCRRKLSFFITLISFSSSRVRTWMSSTLDLRISSPTISMSSSKISFSSIFPPACAGFGAVFVAMETANW
mmetsp:Transcript_16785/g.29064  ORF Transcript_16785/g.29064 Transcript_16785/m.29064 type:complete len:225 (+) Transcript_16785:1387-2061(+)